MKKMIVFMMMFAVLFVCNSYAGTATCKLPKGCKYMDSEFSTGGGNKHSYMMEVTCTMPNGNIVKYTSWNISVGNMFGFGRFTAPKKIVFTKGNKDELVCSY